VPLTVLGVKVCSSIGDDEIALNFYYVNKAGRRKIIVELGSKI
jgi:hypothetical protein